MHVAVLILLLFLHVAIGIRRKEGGKEGGREGGVKSSLLALQHIERRRRRKGGRKGGTT
jgi:hypothetical protein